MVQRYVFPQATQISNVGDPDSTDLTGAVTVNYLNNNVSPGLFLDGPGSYTNAQVASGTITLTNAIAAGAVSTIQVQSTGAAGTEISIQVFINGRGASQVWALAGFPNQTFTIASTVGNTGQVTINFSTAVTFASNVAAGVALQFQSVAPSFTPFRDLVLGTNLTGTIANNALNRPTLTLNATGGGATGSAIDIGTSYVGDNIGSLVRVVSTSPTLTNIAGSLAAVTDYGSINITSTPWPPVIPAGFNTYFVVIEASDFSWSGIGVIQSTPTNAIVQIAWIRRPTVPAGTTFSGGRLWVTTNATAASWITTSVANIANVNPTTATVWPDLVLGSITTSPDGYGSNASVIRLVPTIDSEIARLVGSVPGVTLWPSTVSPPVAAVTATTIVVDDEILGPQLVNQYLWVNSSATQPNTVFVTSGVQTGVQYTLTVTGNPITAGFSITTPNIWYSSTATPNRYNFVPAPQAEVIRLAQANTVPSLNGLQGNPVTLTAGTGIGIATTPPGTIQITNTGSGGGITASNFTSFVVNGGDLGGIVSFASTNSPGANSACFGFGLEPADSQVDGGVINTTTFITTNTTAISPFQYGILYPQATTYTDVEVQIYGWSYTCTFTTTVATGTGVFTLDEYLFSRADSTAANPPDVNANIFPGFRIGNISDDIQLIPLVNSTLVVTGGPTNFSATITGGVFSGVGNQYTHTVATTTVPFIPWQRIVGADINSVSNVVITGYGSIRSLLSLPGTGGNVPTLDQVLAIGNTSARSMTLTGTAVLSTPNLTLNNPGVNTITLRTPATVASTYALTLPSAVPTYGQSLITTDAAGNTGWFLAGIEFIRLASSTNVTPSGAQTVDGVAVATNDRVLLTSQTAPTQQGLYAVSTTGGWTRFTTYPSQSLYVQQGTANSARIYTRNETASPEQWIPTGGVVTIPNLQQVLTAGGTASANMFLQGGVFSTNTYVQLNGATTGNVRLQSPAIVSANHTLTLPPAQGGASTVLTNDGTGILSWGLGGATRQIAAISTVNITPLSGATVVDGYTPVTGDLVLLTMQTTASEQGLYLVSTTGAWTKQITYVLQSFFALNGTVNIGDTFSRTAATPNENFIRSAVSSATTTAPTLQQVTTSGNITNLPILLGTSTDNLSLGQSLINKSAAGNLSVRAGTNLTDRVIIGSSNSTAMNSVAISGAATGNAPTIGVSGDSNLSLNLAGAGSGNINLGTHQDNFVRIAAAATGNAPTIAATGDTNLALNLAGAGTGGVSIGTNRINFVQITGAATGTPPTIAPVGDTNLSLNLAAAGNGTINLGTNQAVYVQAVPSSTSPAVLRPFSSSITNVILGLQGQGSSGVELANNFTNFIRITGAASGIPPTISAAGETNASLNISANGTGVVQLGFNQTNFVRITPTATGVAPTIAAVGDTNISLNLVGSGTGSVNLGTNRTNFVQVTAGASTFAANISSRGETNANLSLSANGFGLVQVGTNFANFVTISGSAGAPTIGVSGTGTVALQLATASGGAVVLNSTQVNALSVTGGAANAFVTLTTRGDTNGNLAIFPSGSGAFQVGQNGTAISLGVVNTTLYNTPLLAANAANPTGNLTAGTAGQVLTSRGAGSTPAWVNAGNLGEGMWTLNAIASGSGATTFGTLNTVQVFNTLGVNYTNTGIALPANNVYVVSVYLAFASSGANSVTFFTGGVGTAVNGTFTAGTTVIAANQIINTGFSTADSQTASGVGRINGGATYIFWIFRTAPASGSTAFNGGTIVIRRVV